MKLRHDLQSFKEISYSLSSSLAGYKSFSIIEKIRFCNDAMEQTKRYCCELWGFDANEYKTAFTFNKDILSVSTKDGLMALSLPNILKIDNPYQIYKSCFHEMRHFYQYKNNSDFVSKNLNYVATSKVPDRQWAASILEADADKFSYSCLLYVAKQNLNSISPLAGSVNLAKIAISSVKTSTSHFVSRHSQNISGMLNLDFANQNTTDRTKTYSSYAFPIVSMEELEGLNKAYSLRPYKTAKTIEQKSNDVTSNNINASLRTIYSFVSNLFSSRRTQDNNYEDEEEKSVAKIFESTNNENDGSLNENCDAYQLVEGGLPNDVDESIDIINEYLNFRKTLGIFSRQNLSAQKILSTQGTSDLFVQTDEKDAKDEHLCQQNKFETDCSPANFCKFDSQTYNIAASYDTGAGTSNIFEECVQ